VRAASRHRTVGLRLAALGIALGMISLVNSLAAGDLARSGGSAEQIGALGAWSFGLTTAAFGTIKLAIGLILLGIVRRIWLRVEAVKATLAELVPVRRPSPEAIGGFDSAFGPASATATPPRPLLIHRMAGLLWAPMLAMGAMLVYGGFLLSLAAAGSVATDPGLASTQRAWVQGIQFLGEGALLSGISFLLGTILAAIRAGGGEVQESLGLTVHTLRMPRTAKLFTALMMAGLMVEVAQFLGYAYIANVGDAVIYGSFSTWLGPLREFGLGLLLSGIVLALATIARALGFQFARIVEIITSGR
jgi:hypothetical protein